MRVHSPVVGGRWQARLGLTALFASGCVGTIGDPGAIGTTPQSDAAAPGTPDAAGMPGRTPAPPTCTGTAQPGATYLRRLTNAEYANTVHDLLGTTQDPTTGFPPEAGKNGYANNAEVVSFMELNAEHYQSAASTLATAVVTDVTRRTHVLGCDVAIGGDTCLRNFIRSFGRRAFRRPLAATEVDQYATLAGIAASDADPYMGASLVLQAMLQSPNFLFRPETGVDDGTHPGLRRVAGYEMATRLSYLLLSTTPDDALLDAAQAGELDTVDGVVTSARRLLADSRAHDGLAVFARQWLRFASLGSVTPDATLYPHWVPALRASELRETSMLFDDLAFRDGANLLDLFDADHTFVDASLANLYGLPAPPGGAFTRVDLTGSDSRGGFFTQASFLTMNSHNDTSSPTRRGRYVREVILCSTPIPPPPAGIPALPPPVPGETARQRLSAHVSNPSCAGCHHLMDPIGLGLEHYDSTGAYHADTTLDVTGQILALATSPDATFDGALDLGRKVASLPETSQCIVTQAFRFAFARTEDDGDACALGHALDRFSSTGHNLREVFLDFVASDAFRYRAPDAPADGGGA